MVEVSSEIIEIVSREGFEKRVRNSMRRSVLSNLGKEVLNQEPFTIEFLSREYMYSYDMDNFPQERIWTLLKEGELHRDRTKLLDAAFATQFYGGIFPEHVNSRRHWFNKSDFDMFLNVAYSSLFSMDSLPIYGILCNRVEKVMDCFRQTSRELRNYKIREIRKEDNLIHINF